jgi:hypothetical protein
MTSVSESSEFEAVPPAIDYASHERQFRRLVHLVKWFCIHALILLAALYFFLVVGQAITGVILLVIALGMFGYGIVSTPQIARDLGRAMTQARETT